MSSSDVTRGRDHRLVPFWQTLWAKPSPPKKTPEAAATDKVTAYAAEVWTRSMFERIDRMAITDAVVDAAAEEFAAYERLTDLVGDSEVKLALAEPKLRMLTSKNNQRINRRFD